MRFPVWRARVKIDGRFLNIQLFHAGLDKHFRGEFHSGTAQPQTLYSILAKTTHTAIHVRDRRFKKKPQNKCQDRRSEPTMQLRHSTGVDLSAETVPHHELSTAAEEFDELSSLKKIVGVICVRHNDISPSRLTDPAAKRASIPLDLFLQ